MSIELNWETLTSGPDGVALCEEIRDFIHDRFQTVPLPRFIKSVSVLAFDFGTVAPEIELKDICDPLPDFYEENEDDQDEEDCDESDDDEAWVTADATSQSRLSKEQRHGDRLISEGLETRNLPPSLDTRLHGLRSMPTTGELGSPFLGASTPGIPGGTSNLSYFHSQLAGGLSGTHTPLAAVAGAHRPDVWPDYNSAPPKVAHHHSESVSSISRPSTADPTQTSLERDSVSSHLAASVTGEGIDEEAVEDESASPPRRFRKPRVEDVQTVFRILYSGNVRLSITTEILLDYPMPSFVGIPIKLNITGLSFDGVAVLAYIRKRAHFCFLSPEDAVNAVGPEDLDDRETSHGLRVGGLLQEIKVESEIGQRENGKQVLKNVGKVEKFVLDQVRRIFEDEFVYPSFWTFLV